MTFKIFGLVTALSYMIVVLCTWIYADYMGYVYFSAGEPNRILLYFEWALGMIAIVVLIQVILNELCNDGVENKHPVTPVPLISAAREDEI